MNYSDGYYFTRGPNETTRSPLNFTRRDSQGCDVIANANASLAAAWENIPETIILNGVIGITLFIIFATLTCIAWRRADSNDRLRTQNIVTFLYGYRNPDNWYVIPRLEFLRREDRHHQHDMLYPNIYVPPKLHLANPLEIFAYGSDQVAVKSIDSAQSRSTKCATKGPVGAQPPAPSQKNANKTINSAGSFKELRTNKSALSDSPLASDRTLGGGHHLSSPGMSGSSLSDITHNSSEIPRNTSGLADGPGNSFFFPSILTAEQMQASYLSRKLNRFFGMFFRVTDADMIYSRGIDAYEYLLFQRHLIFVMFIVTVLCVGVILPIHWIAGTGPSQDSNATLPISFQRSTIKNITKDKALHWAHIVCAGLIVTVTLIAMTSYMDSIMSQEGEDVSRRTLLVGNIPSEQRSRASLIKIFGDYFPRCTIEAIQFVYDTATLVDYETYLSATIQAKQYCLAYKRKNNSEILVHSTDVNTRRTCDGYCRLCSFFYICCCYWPCETREPGTTYYAKEEERFRAKIAEACQKLVREPTEYAFITFRSHKHARRVMSELSGMKQEVLAGHHSGKRVASSDTLESLEAIMPADLVPHAAQPSDPAAKGLHSDHSSETASLKEPHGARANSRPAEGNSADDPLDPKNNPHIRSIRSPYKLVSADNKSESSARNPATAKALVESNLSRSASSSTSEPNHNKKLKSVRRQSRKLEGPVMWSVRYAPHPDNVEFDDLLYLARFSKYKKILLNALMIIIFIFVTTPTVVLSMMSRLGILDPARSKEIGFQGVLFSYLTILSQIVTTAILPALIILISKQIPYEDSSSKGHAVMWKVYTFLVLMVIVMPSIGMSSVQALFKDGPNPKCLFPTDNGAYYINYVISSIFLSTMLELIKPVDILYYYFILWTSRSTAEVEGGRQFVEREFSVGMQHTAVLLIFSVVMTYCISCPLIAPVGLVYLCVKHAVDHYNLYYTYFTKKVDKDLQSTIVIFVKVALLLMLFQTTVAIWHNTQLGYFSLLTQLIFWMTLASLVFNCFFGCASPQPKGTSTKRTRYHTEFCACFYLPKVISNLLRSDAVPPDCISRQI